MFNKTIAFCILQILIIPNIVFASSDINQNKPSNIDNKKIVSVDKCNPLSTFSNNEVKMIKDNLFLDSNGYKVNPCKKNNEVYFAVIEKYENGNDIYKKSDNIIINKSKNKNNININIDDNNYNISYGDKSYNVNDSYDFQNNNSKKELDDKITIIPDNTITNINDIKNDIKLPKIEQLDDKFNNYVDEEKNLYIQNSYKDIISKINTLISTEINNSNKEFSEIAINENRTILVSSNIVNQYWTPQKEDNNIDFNNLNGSLYMLYNIKKSKYNYYIGIENKLRDFISDNNTPINTKLSTIDYLSNNLKILTNQADNYSQKENAIWINNYNQLNKLNEQGINKFNTLNQNLKTEYFNIIKNINEQIIINEIDKLPIKITKQQYKALSDIDKYKYKPLKEKNFINKNFYIKLNAEEILKLKNINK